MNSRSCRRSLRDDSGLTVGMGTTIGRVFADRCDTRSEENSLGLFVGQTDDVRHHNPRHAYWTQSLEPAVGPNPPSDGDYAWTADGLRWRVARYFHLDAIGRCRQGEKLLCLLVESKSLDQERMGGVRARSEGEEIRKVGAQIASDDDNGKRSKLAHNSKFS